MMEIISNLATSNKKGQAALEFYIYAGAFIFFLGLIALIFMNTSLNDADRKEAELAYEVGGQYADMVNFALVAGDGFVGKFYVPKTINNRPYDVYFGNMTTGETTGFVTISVNGTKRMNSYSYPLNTKNISGELEIEPANIDEIVLNNLNGTIHIVVD